MIDIENQIIKVRVNNFNLDHFKNMGYSFKANDYIEIPAKHLPDGSGTKVKVQCLYCKIVFLKSWRRYLETKDKICCQKCKKIKMMETSEERYGNRCSLRNPEILKKSIKTNNEKLGVDYPFQNKEILEKCANESLRRHGDNYRKTRKISKQQIKIHSIIGGLLNHMVFPYFLDIFFEEEKIYFEYDGSGHNLSVKKGYISEESFKNRESTRKKFLKGLGYKEFRIICLDDKIPNYKKLIEIKERAFNFLLKENFSSYIIDLSNWTESLEK